MSFDGTRENIQAIPTPEMFEVNEYAMRASVTLTYTGTPMVPMELNIAPTPIVVPPVAVSGSQIYPNTGNPTFWVNFSYTEGFARAGNRLLTISFDDLAWGNTMTAAACAALTSIAFPVMLVCGPFTINNMPALTSLSLPSLVEIASGAAFSPSIMAALTTLSAPNLKSCGAGFGPNTMALLTTLNFPALKTIAGNFSPSSMASLASIVLNSMTDIGGQINISAMAALTTFNMVNLVNLGDGNTANSVVMNVTLGNLVNFQIGTPGVTKSISGTINVSGQKLNAASVNGILALLVSLDGTNGTTQWKSTLTINGGTNAAPSGQGITDKATLIARGATVTTN